MSLDDTYYDRLGVAFVVDTDGARNSRVSVIFAHRMRRTADDVWAITVYLPPGRAVYVVSVDGVMWLDPEDDGRPPNGWGSEYSVRHVVAAAASAANRGAWE